MPGRACGQDEMSTEDRRQQELFRESIFELGATEGSGGVYVSSRKQPGGAQIVMEWPLMTEKMAD